MSIGCCRPATTASRVINFQSPSDFSATTRKVAIPLGPEIGMARSARPVSPPGALNEVLIVPVGKKPGRIGWPSSACRVGLACARARTLPAVAADVYPPYGGREPCLGTSMIPPCNEDGYLPPGIHPAGLEEIATRFGQESELRRAQMESLRWLVELARGAGAERI